MWSEYHKFVDFFSISNVILVLQKYDSLKVFSLGFKNLKHSLLYIY